MTTLRRFIVTTLAITSVLTLSGPAPVHAQFPTPYPAAPIPFSQRQLFDQLKMQLNWLNNATRTASNFGPGADTVLWNNFEGIRVGFGALTRSLSPKQLDYGANDLAELDAGLAIIGEAFTNFQDDLSNGRSVTVAYHTLCQVLRESMRLWAQELNRVAKRLQIGR
jgi:hypothetical protein